MKRLILILVRKLKPKPMAIFKEAEVRELLNMVHSEQISFSKFVEMLNDSAYDKLAKDGGLVTMMEVVRVVELFIVSHSKPLFCKHLLNRQIFFCGTPVARLTIVAVAVCVCRY